MTEQPGAGQYLDLVVLADGHGAHVVLLPQLLGQGRGHDFPADVGGGIEVPFAVLAAVRGHKGVELHFGCTKKTPNSWRGAHNTHTTLHHPPTPTESVRA